MIIHSRYGLIAGAIAAILSAASVFAAATEPSGATTAAVTFFPAASAKEVCPDTPLRITFSSPPAIGTTGKIQIFDASDNKPVETIDVASRTAVQTIGGLSNYTYYPVIINGNEADIYPHNGALSYDKSYYVTIDPGAFKNYAGLSNATDWVFSTKQSAPVSDATEFTIAPDGAGDFCTIQGAVDFIPDDNKTPMTLHIRKGVYTEMVSVNNKSDITFLGEDRKQTIVQYADNNAFNRAPGVYRRGMFLANRCDDLVLANLTIRNTTPYHGSQAEAIILNGSPQARAILTDVDLYSFQDTLQINGQAYLSDCYIQGDVDFMWGRGPCFFENCHCTAVHSKGYYTQIRNGASNHGYVYHNCVLDGSEGVSNMFLSRIAPNAFPNSEVVLLDCELTSAVSPVGWRFDRVTTNPTGVAPGADVHFWEFNSHDAQGNAVDTSHRFAASRQLKLPQDQEIVTDYSNPTFVLGNDWSPQLAPIVTTQPQSLNASPGQKVSFSAGAAAVPAPTYQWQKNGSNITGATTSTLSISSCQPDDAGNYTVTITNSAGKATSSVAALSLVR